MDRIKYTREGTGLFRKRGHSFSNREQGRKKSVRHETDAGMVGAHGRTCGASYLVVYFLSKLRMRTKQELLDH